METKAVWGKGKDAYGGHHRERAVGTGALEGRSVVAGTEKGGEAGRYQKAFLFFTMEK